MLPVALSIAGSDPSGGAGIQADLKTFQSHGVFGQAVITLLTVQNTRGVQRVEPVSAELVRAQIEALWSDTPPAAVKTGALPDAACVRVVRDCMEQLDAPLVVDPLLRSSSGAAFGRDLPRALCELLLPRCTLITPNLDEAAALTGRPVRTADEARAAAEQLLELGAGAALVTGGHLPDAPVDWLALPHATHAITGDRIHTRHTHGTGCAYSASIVSRLGHGETLHAAVVGARAWLTEALRRAPGLGRGAGPLGLDLPADRVSRPPKA